jgi:uncharacterized protein (TIGR02594 family)
MNLMMTVTADSFAPVADKGYEPPPAVTGERRALREAPHPAAAIKLVLEPGTSVDMVGFHNESGSWAEVRHGKLSGFVHLGALVPSAAAHLPWMQIAHREIGVTQKNHGQRVQTYIETAPAGDDPDWCAFFIGWCMLHMDQERYNSGKTFDWRDWGEKRAFAEPLPKDCKIGDIAIGQRKNPASRKGHIAIFVAYDEKNDRLLLLGGNQAEDPRVEGAPKSVRYSWYPRFSAEPYGRLLSMNYQPGIDKA